MDSITVGVKPDLDRLGAGRRRVGDQFVAAVTRAVRSGEVRADMVATGG